MSLEPYLFIVNPVAGKNQGQRMISHIQEICTRKKVAFDILVTEGVGGGRHAMEQAIHQPYQTYVAVGGDGTVNEVMNGLQGSGKHLGIVPCGTGNDFARALQLPADPVVALEQLLNGQVVEIDLGQVNEHYFINIASIGLDAEIADYTNKLKKWLKSTVAYVLALVRILVSYRPITIRFNDGVGVKSSRAMLLALCNGSYYGGGMEIAPGAKVDDGLLDSYLVKAMPKLKLLFFFPTVFKGKHTTFQEVEVFRSKEITVTSESPFKINVDGEIVPPEETEGKYRAVFKIYPKQLKLVK